MKNILSNFITAFKAEHIKIKGTAFYLLSCVIGIITPILYFIVTMIRNNDEIKDALPYNYYLDFIQGCLSPFADFFFPLLIIISVSRIAQIDHKNGGWKLMETQPAHKLSIYFSKFSVVLLANLFSILSFVIFSFLSAYILTFFVHVPKAATTGFPLGDIIHIITRLFIACLFITALQYFISVLIPSFIWSIVIGFFGLLLPLFLNSFHLIPDWYPYQILSKIASNKDGSDLGYWFTFTEYVGVICSIIILYIGYHWYKFKKLKLAFFDEKFKTATLLLVVIVFGGLLFYILKPNQMPEYNSTILCGKIESDMNFKNAYIIDQIIDDTIAIIPIKDNSFHYQFDKNVILDYYTLVFDGKLRTSIFFGKNDSLLIEGKFLHKQQEFKIKGTRLAENQMTSNAENGWSRIKYMLKENIIAEADKFQKYLYDEWKGKMDVSNQFKTVDNYIPKSDFSERNKKLLTVTYLNYWDEFLKKRNALYPNEKIHETLEIKKLKDKVFLSDESLLSNDEYFEYVSNQLIKNNHQDIDENTKSIEAIAKLPKGTFKDKMLYKQMSKSLEEASNTNERNQLMAQYINQFNDSKYKDKSINNYQTIESLSKGKPASAFEGFTMDGTTVALADLLGKYVLIDVWASWCGPCKYQSSFFEKFALKYKKENIQFVALSVDEKKDNWLIEAKSKSKSVLQLFATNQKLLSKNYNIPSIPRFILIDTNGNFVNAEMPAPSEKSFEILLRKALNLPDEDAVKSTSKSLEFLMEY